MNKRTAPIAALIFSLILSMSVMLLDLSNAPVASAISRDTINLENWTQATWVTGRTTPNLNVGKWADSNDNYYIGENENYADGELKLDNVTTIAYYENGYIESSIYDAGVVIDIENVYWDNLTPTNTSLVISVRTGGDNDPYDGGWSAWCVHENSVENVSLLDNRYAQYRIDLSTTDNTVTPILYSIVLLYYVNHAPDAPTNLLVESSLSPQNLITFTPTFSFLYVDNDNDNSAAINIQVGTSAGDNSLWNNLQDNVAENNTVISVPYAGSALSRGTLYWWHIRVRDNTGDWSAWSDNENFKINQLPTAPTLYTNLGTRETDHTPAIEWVKGTDADSDTVTMYVYLDNVLDAYPATTLENSTTENIENIGENSIILIDGENYSYRLRSWDGYEWSAAYSASDNFKMNTLPEVENQKVDGQVNPSEVATLAPTLSWNYWDADNDNQVRIRIQVGTSLNDNSMWDDNRLYSTESLTYAGSTLTRGVIYYWRICVFDNYEWSNWLSGGTFRSISSSGGGGGISFVISIKTYTSTMQPIASTTLQLKKDNALVQFAQTDAMGGSIIYLANTGTYEISASKAGYVSQTRTVNITGYTEVVFRLLTIAEDNAQNGTHGGSIIGIPIPEVDIPMIVVIVAGVLCVIVIIAVLATSKSKIGPLRKR